MQWISLSCVVTLDGRMAVDPEKEGWDALPSTDSGGFYRIEPNIILAVPLSSFKQTVEHATRSLALFDRLAEEEGSKQSIIVLVDRVASQDAAARRVWSTPRERETRCAQALVCDTILARAIGSFFLGLNRAAVPTRMFASLDEALLWARRMARENGGRI